MWKKLAIFVLILLVIAVLSVWVLFFSQSDILESDLPPLPPLPEMPPTSQNGFAILQLACKALKETPYLDNYEMEDWDAVSIDVALAGKDLALNAPALHLLKQAVEAPYFVPTTIGRGLKGLDDHLSDYRTFTWLLTFKTKVDIKTGDSRSALSNIDLGLQLSNRLTESSHTMIHHLVAVACHGIILASATEAAYAFPDDKQFLTGLAKSLEMNRLRRTDAVNSYRGEIREQRLTIIDSEEYSVALEVFDWFTLTGNSALDRFLAPHQFKPNLTSKWQLDIADHLDKEQSLGIHQRTEGPYASLTSASVFEKLRTGNAVAIEIHLANHLSYANKHSIAIYKHELLETAIACRLHELETGSVPLKLTDLKPKYLDFVGRDAHDGKPFRYDPKRRIIWVVSENGVDDGGKIHDSYSGDIIGLNPDGTYCPQLYTDSDLTDDMGLYLMPGPPRKPKKKP